ncbi:MAG: formate/nitrite transporter family protein [Deltaproteobacteria bacterium]|jgi:formate/nitrite transporter|nr:formate/nitrite transporter family protein [Deltaproteobacteria bacterium]
MGRIRNTAETVGLMLAIGKAKARLPLGPHLLQSALAGAYIGFGAVLALKVTGNLDPSLGNLTKLLFGLVFPIGLLMVLIAGASLFTGDVMYLSCSWAERDATGATWLRFLSVSFLGNFLGSVLLAWLACRSGALLDPGPGGTLPLAEAAVRLANAKTGLPFGVAFVRGVLCNWLVCLAIYMSLTADSGISKAVLMWPPITAFVALGMEHSVANMCFVPLGIFLGNYPEFSGGAVGPTATWGAFLARNLVPVTLGNIVGGALFVGLPYLWLCKGKKEEGKD